MTGAIASTAGSVRRPRADDGAIASAAGSGSRTVSTGDVAEPTGADGGGYGVDDRSAGAGSITLPTAERSPVVAVSRVAVPELGVPAEATAALLSFGLTTGSVTRSTAPDNADAMPGAGCSGGSLGDGASSDGVGLFVAVFVLAGVVERVLVAAEVLVSSSWPASWSRSRRGWSW